MAHYQKSLIIPLAVSVVALSGLIYFSPDILNIGRADKNAAEQNRSSAGDHNNHSHRAEVGSEERSESTPTRIPDFQAAKSITKDHQLDAIGNSTTTSTQYNRAKANHDLEAQYNSDSLSNSESIYVNDLPEHPAYENINWQYPAVSIPGSTVANFQKKIAYAQKLARIGAIASSEKEAQLALHLVAESLDFSVRQPSLYLTKTSAVFVTLKELNDLRTENGQLFTKIQSHKTAVLKNASAASLSRNSAQLAYLNHAEQQLSAVFANYSFCSEAFYTLGKIYLSHGNSRADSEIATMKSMLMFRMAVALNPADSRSANELGTLYASLSYLEIAKEYLLQSVNNGPTPSAWQNLAKIHHRLGENQLAMQAENEFQRMNQGRSQTVDWVSPDSFGRSNQLGSAQVNMAAPAIPAQQNAGLSPTFQPQPRNQTKPSVGRIAGIPIPNLNLWK